jgi:hypothetical protein
VRESHEVVAVGDLRIVADVAEIGHGHRLDPERL